jgi:selenocysteine lyase/cysteine desulfurase
MTFNDSNTGACEQCGSPIASARHERHTTEADVNRMRRTLTQTLGGAAVCALAGTRAASLPLAAETLPATELPDRTQFSTGSFEICLNNARWHPLSLGAQAAVESYLEYKRRGIWQEHDMVSSMQDQARSGFATLIGAAPEQIAFVNSTTTAESLFAAALGFPALKGNIVTDALHFEGSLYLYTALARQGVDVRIVRPRAWGIPLDDMAAVIDKNTRLVAVSQVSYINGFEHDLAPLCELAHAHGALVYADAVQAAGAIPIDVRTSGIDAMAAASYKWLMGDMGLAFLYVHPDVLPRLRRPLYGYRQIDNYATHIFPWDKPGAQPVEFTQTENAAGYFETGTYANAAIAALSFSLPWLQRIGIANVQAHAQKLIAPLRDALPALGYECITPASSRAPIVSFRVTDAARTEAALRHAKIDVSLNEGYMRISPSVYNTGEDIDRLLAALA